MNAKDLRVRRCLPADTSRPLNASDLIPLTTAINMLSEWHDREYTLADIQKLVVAGSDNFTPVFYYEGKAVVYNPQTLVNNDLIEHYDGNIPDKAYQQYFEIWLRSPQPILDINGWFSLDLRSIKGLEIAYLAHFTEYLQSPDAKITQKAMLEICRINHANIQRSPVACFPIDTVKHRHSQTIAPLSVKTSPLSVGLYDWYIPQRQIEILHPNFECIYQIGNQHYIGVQDSTGYIQPKAVSLNDFTAPFYQLILSSHLAPLSIQLIAQKSEQTKATSRQPINPHTIGHNAKVDKRRAVVREIAINVWEHDTDEIIKTGVMVNIIRAIFKTNGLNGLPNDRNLKNYFRDITPDYAKKGGQPTAEQQSSINAITRDMVNKYSQTDLTSRLTGL